MRWIHLAVRTLPKQSQKVYHIDRIGNLPLSRWAGFISLTFDYLPLLNSVQVESTNMVVARSVVGRHFRLEFSDHEHQRKGSRFLTELNAGLATFFAMAYIISVNAQIVSRKSIYSYYSCYDI